MIVGVDSGLNGAVARVDIDGNLLYSVDIPTMHIGSSKKRRVSVARLRPLVRSRGIVRVRIEHVWSFKKEEGAAAGFNFGAAVDAVRGAFEILHPTDMVLPTVWKEPFGLGGGEESKAQALEIARELWPEHAGLFKHKKNAGRAEAALIAEQYRMETQR